jgi:hypothetical protein
MPWEDEPERIIREVEQSHRLMLEAQLRTRRHLCLLLLALNGGLAGWNLHVYTLMPTWWSLAAGVWCGGACVWVGWSMWRDRHAH